MEGEKEKERNWSEEVEELVDDYGDIEGAICVLETLISKMEICSQTNNPQLVSALLELANLYSSKGFSLKSDHARSRAFAINTDTNINTSVTNVPASGDESAVVRSRTISSSEKAQVEAQTEASSDDDWEAIADLPPDELLVSLHNNNSKSDSELMNKLPNRRGRGTFTYNKQTLDNDHHTNDDSTTYHHTSHEQQMNLYGTHHVLVLDGFHPTTTTTHLETLFQHFTHPGFAIRWVHDTLALAVFPSPSLAVEAKNTVRCSFKVRVLEEDDSIMSSISIKDLEPPRQRPKTSARTAQRLIAQELGIKLPSTFGSRELKKQESDRRNRIVSRQTLRDEAWGPDDLN